MPGEVLEFPDQKMREQASDAEAREASTHEKMLADRREVIAKLRQEAKEKGEPPIYDPELERITAIVKEHWWKFDKLEDRIRAVAAALGMEPAAVQEAIEEAITPDCLVRVRLDKEGQPIPIVEALAREQYEMYCLLEVLKKGGFEINVWTLGDAAWQKNKFERTGASKFIDDEHLFVAEGEKLSTLRKILDKILADQSKSKPIHVYVVDDNPDRINEALSLSKEYESKGIIIHDYQLKIKDPQADGTAFYKWITRERGKQPNSILVLDFDQTIADTDGALNLACENILRRKQTHGKPYPMAA